MQYNTISYRLIKYWFYALYIIEEKDKTRNLQRQVLLFMNKILTSFDNI